MAERFDSRSGSIFRVVTTFGSDGVPQAWAVFPPGNSGDPQSPHFADTLEDWVEDEYTFLPFTREEVEAVEETTIILEP